MPLRKKNTIYVDGFDGLSKGFEEVGKSISKQVLEEVGREALIPMEKVAEALAPVDEGHLQKSIAISKKLSGRQKRLQRSFWGELGVPKPTAEVYMGAGPTPAAHLQEFGTVNHEAQPFIRPAWDQHKKTALFICANLMKFALAKGIQKARRLAMNPTKKRGRGRPKKVK